MSATCILPIVNAMQVSDYLNTAKDHGAASNVRDGAVADDAGGRPLRADAASPRAGYGAEASAVPSQEEARGGNEEESLRLVPQRVLRGIQRQRGPQDDLHVIIPR